MSARKERTDREGEEGWGQEEGNMDSPVTPRQREEAGVRGRGEGEGSGN